VSSEAARTEVPAVIDNPQRERFELRVGGALAGVAEYRRHDGVITFTHTEIDPEQRGRGLAAVLVGAALEASAAAGLHVVAVCPYVREYIDERNSGQPGPVGESS
jgi:uncharacterized protein